MSSVEQIPHQQTNMINASVHLRTCMDVFIRFAIILFVVALIVLCTSASSFSGEYNVFNTNRYAIV